jgi:hypothetical protein
MHVANSTPAQGEILSAGKKQSIFIFQESFVADQHLRLLIGGVYLVYIAPRCYVWQIYSPGTGVEMKKMSYEK